MKSQQFSEEKDVSRWQMTQKEENSLRGNVFNPQETTTILIRFLPEQLQIQLYQALVFTLEES